MTRRKIKLSLIDDYIKIVQIKNFSNNSFDEFTLNEKSERNLTEIHNLSTLLEKTLESLFETLKLNDLSFCILKKELDQNNSLFFKTNSQNVEHNITISLLTINTIISNLKSKIDNLKINFHSNIFAKI